MNDVFIHAIQILYNIKYNIQYKYTVVNLVISFKLKF